MREVLFDEEVLTCLKYLWQSTTMKRLFGSVERRKRKSTSKVEEANIDSARIVEETAAGELERLHEKQRRAKELRAKKRAEELARREAEETRLSRVKEIELEILEYQHSLAQAGSSAETAIEAALHISHLSRSVADVNRPILVQLARKFIRDDERVLGFHFEYQYNDKYTELKLVGIVVILTFGFAVKSGAKRYRVDLDHENEFGSASDRVFELSGLRTAKLLHLGDLSVSLHFQYETGSNALPPSFAALLLQGSTSNYTPEHVFDFYNFWSYLDESEADKGEDLVEKTELQSSGRPALTLIRTWRDAELAAASWMRYWGFSGVICTGLGVDGGIDVVSNEAVAQVKAETVSTGRPKIQQHHGIAVGEGKLAIFFALAGYTTEAKQYADKHGILLFRFDLQGEPESANLIAETYLKTLE